MLKFVCLAYANQQASESGGLACPNNIETVKRIVKGWYKKDKVQLVVIYHHKTKAIKYFIPSIATTSRKVSTLNYWLKSLGTWEEKDFRPSSKMLPDKFRESVIKDISMIVRNPPV